MYPADLKYTQEHEWLKVEDGNRARMGITEYAQHELGDVVFVELPEVGDTVTAGDNCAVVESVKAVSDIYAPVSGTIVAVNEELANSPELVNTDPYGKGWIAIIEMTHVAEADELLNAQAYQKSIDAE